VGINGKLLTLFNVLDDKIENLKLQVESFRTVQGERGEKGDRGEAGKSGLNGKDGKDGISGKEGKVGKDGLDGKDGIGVEDARIDLDNHLTLILSDGSEIDAGEIPTATVVERVSSVTRVIAGENDTDMNYDTLIDEDGVYTYIGKAIPSTATSKASWQIKRIEDLGAGDSKITYANGVASFSLVWDNRLSYTY